MFWIVFLIVSATSCNDSRKEVNARHKSGTRQQNGHAHVPDTGNGSGAPHAPLDRHPFDWEVKAQFDLQEIIKEPTKAKELIGKWGIPRYVEMSSREKEAFVVLAANIGQCNTIPVEVRFNFIRSHVPDSVLPYTVDDMITLLPKPQIMEIEQLVETLPSGRVRTELLGQVGRRMMELGATEDDLNKWIESLDYNDERNDVRFIIGLKKKSIRK